MAANLIDDSQLQKTREMIARCRELVPAGEPGCVRPAGTPSVVVERGEGAYFFDVDGNAYVDWCLGHGSMVFGHRPKPILDSIIAQITQGGMLYALPHELEYEVARKIGAAVPGVEKVGFVNSGSEATQAAVRLARAWTGKDKVMKWEGGCQGFHDSLAFSQAPPLEAAGRERFPRTLPSWPGVPKALEETVVVAPFNDIDAVEVLVRRHRDELACVVAEPVLSGAGVVPPAPGFLEGLRRICDENEAVLVFDEVVTGFRVALGGAQELYGVAPDITCLGGAIGGGTPGAAAVGGKKEIMDLGADGAAASVGTYSGNPTALAGMNATLDILINDRERVYGHLHAIANAMVSGMRGIFAEHGVPASITQAGPMWGVTLGDEEPATSYRRVLAGDTHALERLRRACQARGVYMRGSGLGRFFASTAHTKTEVDRSLEAIAEAAGVVKEALAGSRRGA